MPDPIERWDTIEYRRYSPRPRINWKKIKMGKRYISSEDNPNNTLENQGHIIARYCEITGLPKTRLVLEDPHVSARKVPLARRGKGRILVQQVKLGARRVVVSALDRIFR